MRKFILTVLIAGGLGLAGTGGASTIPAAGVQEGVINGTPLVEQVQDRNRSRRYKRMYRDRNRHQCRSVKVCRIMPWGGRRCHVEQRCPR